MKTAVFNTAGAASFDYSTQGNCASYGCDSICRCSRIVNLSIVSISIDPAMFMFQEHVKAAKGVKKVRYKPTEIETYCIDRLLRIYKAYDASLYTVGITGGYYGEEIGEVSFQRDTEIVRAATSVVNFATDVDKIKFVLTEEYSYVLDSIKDATAVTIESLDPKRLGMNTDYAMRIKNERVDYSFANEYDLPVGVVYKNRLIDGYHRFASLDRNQEAKFVVLQ